MKTYSHRLVLTSLYYYVTVSEDSLMIKFDFCHT